MGISIDDIKYDTITCNVHARNPCGLINVKFSLKCGNYEKLSVRWVCQIKIEVWKISIGSKLFFKEYQYLKRRGLNQ